ncbi:MAG: ADP-ribosylglycohydrolase family protein [Nannocystales bacterium]
MAANTHAERLALASVALEGLAVGDAFGEQFFVFPAEAVLIIEQRSFPKPPWPWTDDTAMALSVVEVLAGCQGIDSDALATAFARRYQAEPDRGYGPGAHRILQSIAEGVPWQEAASSAFGGQGSFGNGAAMRAAPIGAYFWDDDHAVVENAGRSAAPTHAHPEGQAGAIAVAVAAATAARIARGECADNRALLFERVAMLCPPGVTRDRIIEAQTMADSDDAHRVAAMVGNGEGAAAQDTVPFSIWCAARRLDNFEEAMWTTVSALGDRDTTCAIVGGIVAARVGREGLPARFLKARERLPSS